MQPSSSPAHLPPGTLAAVHSRDGCLNAPPRGMVELQGNLGVILEEDFPECGTGFHKVLLGPGFESCRVEQVFAGLLVWLFLEL